MNQHTLQVLEYQKIKNELKARAATYLGKEKVDRLFPKTSLADVEHSLQETSEAKKLIAEAELSLGGVRDIRTAVSRAARGAILEPAELLDVASTLAAASRVKKLFTRQEGYPILADFARQLEPLDSLRQDIGSKIEDEGRVSDSASSALRRIRREIAAANQNIRDKLQEIVQSTRYRKYLQEPIITMRQGRHVIPVKQEFKDKVNGIVHDESASGATVFVEPMRVVEITNRLRQLEAREREEVERILAELAAAVGDSADEIRTNLEVLAHLDFVKAKALYSMDLQANEPLLCEDYYIRLKNARHPLLDRDTAVPIDVRLGRSFRTLVITGPNTGGKTVTLKTIGLLVLMTLSGLHIPAEADSTVGIFQEVFADIGDEQSIEQSLSTFSSHMTNIIKILKTARHGSLVLLDELGAGTDPQEGAVLGMAILENLHQREARTVATTHYSELKAFAFSRGGVENASVEFDEQTLQPTYRLIIGLPGKSSAFIIARRLGLPEEVISRARDFLTVEQVRVEDLIASLQENRKQSEQARRDADAHRREMERLRRASEQEQERILEAARRERERARQEALDMIKDAKQTAAEIIEELREAAKHKSAADIDREIHNATETLSKKVKELREQAEIRPARVRKGAKLREGDVREGLRVYVGSLDRVGEIIGGPDEDGRVIVQVGPMKATVSTDDVSPVEVEKPADQGRVDLSGVSHEPVSSEIHLRGKRIAEALPELEKYLDSAYVAGLPHVYIIHGKGTGKMRRTVHKLLDEHPFVKSYRMGEQGEGGFGVTVAELVPNH